MAISVFAGLSVIAHGEVVLVPTTDCEIPTNQTVVYCPTFLAGWHGLKTAVGGDVGMQNEPDLVRVMNRTPFPSNSLPEDAFLMFAGRIGPGVIEGLQTQLRAKFRDKAPALPQDLLDLKAGLIVYGHLYRALPFPRYFVRPERQLLRFKSSHGETQVQFFGSTPDTSEEYADQTKIVHWLSDSEFTLELRTRKKGESIVLAKMAKPERLLTAVARVKEQLHAKRGSFHRLKVNGKEQELLTTLGSGDLLAIPLIDLRVASSYAELCGRKLTNEGYQHLWLAQAYQDVQFKMDETGAVVESTMYGMLAVSMPRRSSIPRQFIFDRPFLLMLWKEDADAPYLVVWVATSDVMVPLKK